MTLLDGEIWLDDTYDSGIEGYPGARFVISLQKLPLSEELIAEHTKTHLLKEGTIRASIRKNASDPDLMDDDSESSFFSIERDDSFVLPESLSCLFVDDDAMLRKVSVSYLRRASKDDMVHPMSLF